MFVNFKNHDMIKNSMSLQISNSNIVKEAKGKGKRHGPRDTVGI